MEINKRPSVLEILGAKKSHLMIIWKCNNTFRDEKTSIAEKYYQFRAYEKTIRITKLQGESLAKIKTAAN